VTPPVLSITMPTRNRPERFERALGSVLQSSKPVAAQVEVTVSDGSKDERTQRVAHRLLAGWPGGYRYVWNRPALGMAENFNRAVELASGEWIHQLHDDDYLLPGAGAFMVDTIHRINPEDRVLLFGVDVVDASDICKREQTFRRERYLEPKKALRCLLHNSSFVRQPAVLIHRSALQNVGLFDTTVGGPADIDMWLRLFSQYGVRCVARSTCAYRIHEDTITTGMWNPDTIKALCEIFNRAVTLGIVPERKIRRWQSDYFHQFILAGVYRRLRAGRWKEARDVLALFGLPEVRELDFSPKWLLVRAAFVVTTVTASGASGVLYSS
jgi:glycosyltransferase involved in cell wall biosynthesis